MAWRLALVASCVLACVAPHSARAWTPVASDRPVWCGPAGYAMNVRGSDDLGPDVSEAELRRAMEEWTRTSCTSSLTVELRPRTSARPRSGDGVSAVGWIESRWRHDRNVIGATTSVWEDGCFTEGDIELNGEAYRWTTESGDRMNVNAYSILLHEAGHYLGLGHSGRSDAVMYYAYGGGRFVLSLDDERGICALYPAAGADCTTTGCAYLEECVDGTCRPPRRDGTPCALCRGPWECGGPDDYCLKYPDTIHYCGRACDGAVDCDEGYECVDVGYPHRQCVRFEGGIEACPSPFFGCRDDSNCPASARCDVETGRCVALGGGAALGEECTTEADCATGACLRTPEGGTCTRSCDWLDPLSCPAGFYCDGSATGLCGSGACVAGLAGTAELGSPCERATDCAELFCSGGRCSRPCVPEADGACPEPFVCTSAESSACGACAPPADWEPVSEGPGAAPGCGCEAVGHGPEGRPWRWLLLLLLLVRSRRREGAR